MSPEWLYYFTRRRNLTRFFSLLTGIGILILADGWILVRLARRSGVYFALALEGLITLAAAIVVGGTINAMIHRIRTDAAAGHYDGRRFSRLAAVILSAVLLFVPGFATDLVGVIVYLPPGRHIFAHVFHRRKKEDLHRVYEYITMELFSVAAPTPHDARVARPAQKSEPESKEAP